MSVKDSINNKTKVTHILDHMINKLTKVVGVEVGSSYTFMEEISELHVPLIWPGVLLLLNLHPLISP
jgi:hypothetical protein